MLFSQRQGITPIKSVLQVDSIDDELRNVLWNALMLYYWEESKKHLTNDITFFNELYSLLVNLWNNYFKYPLDTLNKYWENTYKNIRDHFFKFKWYEVYNFIEFIANNYSDDSVNQKFMKYCNIIFERELSAYRFVGGKITQITSEEEIAEIEEALDASKPVANHLKRALNLLADKKNPDYRTSIKESISAVEAICRLITSNSNATLGQALDKIEREGKVNLHPALKKAFVSLYGYTSNAEGIRHALLDEPNLNFEDAKIMLVSCSGFVNYLKVKSSKIGIKL